MTKRRARTALLGARRQSGQAVVLAALMIFALIGAVGLGIDVGNAAAHQRQDQSAADGAALAAADRLANGQTEATATAAAQNVASLIGVPAANLTVNYLDGSRNPQTDPKRVVWVQANVNESVPTFFMRVLGVNNVNVKALAEVRYPKRCALCFLDPSASPALHVSGNGGVNVTGDCVQVNSNAAPAVALDSSGNVVAPCTNVVGSVVQNSSGRVTPAASTGVAPVPDPLANLPYPVPPMTNGGNISVGGSDMVILPGYYGQWTLGGSGSLWLSAGTYVLTGPPSDTVAVSSGGTIKNCPVGMAGCPAGVTPGGVTLFFTCSNWATVATASGPICPCPATNGSDINISSNGGLQITAPTSGTYQGVAIFFDRCNNGAIAITANGGVPVLGAIYAKASPLFITANGPCAVNGLVITASTDISANASLTINYDPTNPAQAVQAQWMTWGLSRLVT